MDKKEVIENLDFYGNYVFYSCYIYAHAVLTDSERCIIDNNIGFIALYNPDKEELLFLSETENRKVLYEITEFEKLTILENLKKAYFSKYGREVVPVWRELSKLQYGKYA